MNINVYEIINSANIFTNEMVKKSIAKSKNISSEEKNTIYSEFILNTSQGKTYVDNMVLGAIIAYHDQLQTKFLELGIDIGDIVVK